MQIKTKLVSCHTMDSKPVKPEVNSTVILPPLGFPAKVDTYFSLIAQKILTLDSKKDYYT
jgi:hypothetical protein